MGATIITIHSSAVALDAHRVLHLPHMSVGESWEGGPLREPMSLCVAVDPERVWFSCTLQQGASPQPSYRKGEFVEGLWENDVAELFIRDAHGAYQEFNFSPAGAWWSMTHSSYRVRSAECARPELVVIEPRVFEATWSVVAAFSRASLHVPLTSSSLVHITGISYDPAPTYISSCSHPKIKPDFHFEGCFVPVRFVPIAVGC